MRIGGKEGEKHDVILISKYKTEKIATKHIN